jgi:dipeptidyl aminopeptidase/acylaminoacyl peptidase
LPSPARRLALAVTLSLTLSALPALLAPPAAFARQQPAPTAAPTVAAKKPITHDVYDSWRSIQGETLSRDGAWAVYALQPQDGDAEFVARDLKTGREWRTPLGRTPLAVTPDSRFVVFTLAPPKAEVEKARKAKKKPEEMPKNALGILDLTTGKVERIERVRRFALAEEGSRYVAYVVEPAPAAPAAKKPDGEAKTEEKKTGDEGEEDQARAGGGQRRPGGAAGAATPSADAPPAELVVRDLTTGQAVLTVPDAADGFAWSRPGTRLAYTIDSKKKPDSEGVFVGDLAAGTTTTLAVGKGTYKALTWDYPGERLAFLSAPEPVKPEDKKDDVSPAAPPPAFSLRLWKPGQATPAETVVPDGDLALPKGTVVSDNDGSLQFTRDGRLLFFAFKPAPKAPRPKDAPDPVKVDLWSWKDPYLQSQQKSRAEQEKRRDYAAVYRLDEKRILPLGAADGLPSVQTGEFSTRWALAADDTAYRQLPSWDRSYRDVYVVDLKSGARRKILTRQPGQASLSPDEKWVLWWEETPDEKGGRWLAQDVEGKKPPVPLTPATGAPSFCDEEQDEPSPPSPYGVAGWTKGDRSVLLYDRYDVWEAFPDGRPARRLTAGREAKRVHRWVRLDPEERAADPAAPAVLSVVDEATKASGYARLSPFKDGAAPTVTTLTLRDERQDGLRKAKNAGAVFFTRSRFDQFPDLWVSTAGLEGLDGATRLTDANPQQANYRWGKARLIEFTSEDGVPLRGVLYTPDGFDPAKKYPLMVNIYEKQSDNLHRYSSPSPGTSINVTRYVSNGYCVLLPDIVYTTGFPGESARKCVIPAVRAVTKQGFIDEKRIGIQGHSWGGYEIAYLITRTNVFRCVEAGAAVADMVSAYGGIRWGGGISRAFQYQRSQSRIGGAPWDKTREFIENSPIFWADRVNTPYLTIHNDEDGAVPWEQGIEFFTALRQLGKEAYMFVYNGEDHNLVGRTNQKHWTVHRDEFFDHYLLGAPRPDWMDKGVPYLEKGERDLTPFYGKQ